MEKIGKTPIILLSIIVLTGFIASCMHIMEMHEKHMEHMDHMAHKIDDNNMVLLDEKTNQIYLLTTADSRENINKTLLDNGLV